MTLDEVKKILLNIKNSKNDKSEYSFFENFSKEELTTLLINLMKNDIYNFDFNDDNDLTYIFQVFDMLSGLIKDNKNLQKKVIKMLTKFHTELVSIIKNRPEELSKGAKSRYELLKNIVDKLEDTSLRLMYLPLDEYDQAKNKFIFYLIFEYKNYDLVKSSIKRYPHIVNLRDENSSIIEKVVDKYLEYLNNYLVNPGYLPEFTYYKDILKMILDDEKLSFSTSDKKSCFKKIKKFSMENSFEKKEEKERLAYYINFLTLSLNGQDTSYFEDLDYEYGVSETFNKEIESEAYKIYLNTTFIHSDNRLYIVSYDDPGPKEIDDALSIQEDGNDLILGVHISDPTDDIKINSIIDDEAFRRVRSLYAFDESIPMLPKILSSDKFSFLENKVRPALSYYYRFDMSKGKLKDFNVVKENIMLSKNSVYEAFDEAVNKGIGDPKFVKLAYDLSQISPLLEKSFNKDSIFFEANNCTGSNIGHKVVLNSMCFTGFSVAKWFYEHNLPFNYRNHTLSNDKLDRLKKLRSDLFLLNYKKNEFNRIILNEYPKAYYSSECAGHNSLGVKHYATVTSPLRRYADITAVRCINKFMIGPYNDDDIIFYLDLVNKVCANINSRTYFNKIYEEAYINKLAARRK